MKKLALDLDSLDVATFEIPSESDPRGTVDAYAGTITDKLRDYAKSWLIACDNGGSIVN